MKIQRKRNRIDKFLYRFFESLAAIIAVVQKDLTVKQAFSIIVGCAHLEFYDPYEDAMWKDIYGG